MPTRRRTPKRCKRAIRLAPNSPILPCMYEEDHAGHCEYQGVTEAWPYITYYVTWDLESLKAESN